ncbi:helix-turn-helix domain-containing protein [Nocardia sp. NPDC004711]
MANNLVARLGTYIQARRHELGMSQIDLWKAGGPSNSTLTALESGSATSISTNTLRKLDHALGWEPGSGAKILAGGEPEPSQASPPPTAEPVPDAADNGGYRVEADGSTSWSMSIPNKAPSLQSMVALLFSLTSLATKAKDMEEGTATLPELLEAINKTQEAGGAVIEEYMGGRERIRDLYRGLEFIVSQME